jgi:hypothetical protein
LSKGNFRPNFYKLLEALQLATFAGKFEGIPYFVSTVGHLKSRAAIALPGVGIFVHPKDINNLELMRHEFGHILQSRKWGKLLFYSRIAWTSLISARKSNRDPRYDHQATWTEWSANKLAYDYFNQPNDWPVHRYPVNPPAVKRKYSELPSKISMQ